MVGHELQGWQKTKIRNAERKPGAFVRMLSGQRFFGVFVGLSPRPNRKRSPDYKDGNHTQRDARDADGGVMLPNGGEVGATPKAGKGNDECEGEGEAAVGIYGWHRRCYVSLVILFPVKTASIARNDAKLRLF
jgi:hypothetical protein